MYQDLFEKEDLYKLTEQYRTGEKQVVDYDFKGIENIDLSKPVKLPPCFCNGDIERKPCSDLSEMDEIEREWFCSNPHTLEEREDYRWLLLIYNY